MHLFDPRKAISPAGLPELCPIFLHVFFKVWILHLLEFEHFATLHSCIACPKLSKGAFCFRSSSRQHGQDLRKRLGQGSGGCASLLGPPQSQQPRKSTQLNFLGLDLGTWALPLSFLKNFPAHTGCQEFRGRRPMTKPVAWPEPWWKQFNRAAWTRQKALAKTAHRCETLHFFPASNPNTLLKRLIYIYTYTHAYTHVCKYVCVYLYTHTFLPKVLERHSRHCNGGLLEADVFTFGMANTECNCNSGHIPNACPAQWVLL